MTEGLRDLATEVARGAGELLLEFADSAREGAGLSGLGSKSTPTDLVSDADRAAEQYIVSRILDERPDDSILAEEGSVHEGTSGIRWVIDPLDGTVNYVYGIPHWCVSIGIEGEARAGVVYHPAQRELFTDVSPMEPSSKTTLAEALIGTGFSYSSEVRARQGRVAAGLLPLVRDLRRSGSCALDLTWVACGRLDGFYEEDTYHWDISAGIAIIEGAGGGVRTHGSLTIAAGTIELLDSLETLVLAHREESLNELTLNPDATQIKESR